jgi:hypothetical protein
MRARMKIAGRSTKLSMLALAVAGLGVAMGMVAWAQSGVSGGFSDTWGPQYRSQITAPATAIYPSVTAASAGGTLARVKIWNFIAGVANAIDHTPVQPGETRVFGEQFGPARSARALAIVHIALFEAVNAVAGGYRSYLNLARVPDASIDAAIAQATHDALVGMYKSQAPLLAPILAADLALIPNGTAKTKGIALGKQAAAAILARRAADGAQHTEPRLGIEYFPPVGVGFWEQDPVSQIPLALGAFWGARVRPFVIQSASQFRIPPPPALNGAAYAASFAEVKRLGGCGDDPDGCLGGFPTATDRTSDQTVAGIYWGYDGTPGLGTPPRLYNQVAVKIASDRGTNAIQLARLLALINVALADAALSSWESKYHHVHWRPITAIRRADEDGNPATAPDPDFTPLGAPATNLLGPNFTPPFPAYDSGHSTLGSATFHVMRLFYGTDNIRFTFVSDEFNGINRDNQGNTRPRLPRSFTSLTHAEDENGQSRIYLGIHWSYDKETGKTQGRSVADYVVRNVFQPR